MDLSWDVSIPHDANHSTVLTHILNWVGKIILGMNDPSTFQMKLQQIDRKKQGTVYMSSHLTDSGQHLPAKESTIGH